MKDIFKAEIISDQRMLWGRRAERVGARANIYIRHWAMKRKLTGIHCFFCATFFMNVSFFVTFSIILFFLQALCTFMYRTGNTDKHFRLKEKVNDFSRNQTGVSVSHVVYVVSALAARATNPASCL